MCNEHGVLTFRERDILRLVYRGHTSIMIAAQLGISRGTVDVHISNSLRKLNVASRARAAVIFAECPVCQSTHSLLKHG